MPSEPPRSSSLVLVLAWLGFLWLVFVVDVVLQQFGIHLVDWLGLMPRTAEGLWGILGCHVLHGNLPHIAGNSLALLILGLLGCWTSRGLTGLAVLYSAFISAAFTWLVAPGGVPHIGASGVAFGLVGFLVCNGLFRRSWKAFFIALPVGLLLASLFPGMLPTEANQAQMISWQMHLGGFLGGALASWQLRRARAT